MKFETADLIEDLIDRTKGVLNKVEGFKLLSEEELNWKTNEERWSILENIQHLNLYADFYVPEMRKQILKAKEDANNGTFKSGWLGNYFANSMLPKEQLNTMKTFKEMNPLGSELDKGTLIKFTNYQKEILDLLNKARKVNLSKVKTGVTISNWIKLKLGDTFRVVIYHHQRHMVQSDKVRINYKKYQKELRLEETSKN